MHTERYQALMDAVGITMDVWEWEPGPMNGSARRMIGYLLDEASAELDKEIAA